MAQKNTYKGEITLIKIKDGQDGNSIVRIIDFYKLGDNAENIPGVPAANYSIFDIESAGWAQTMPTGFGASNPIIWNFKRTEYSDGTVEHSGVVIASFWTVTPEVKAKYCATQETDISKWDDVFNDAVHNYIIFSYDGGETWTPRGGIRIKGKVSVDEEAVIYKITSSSNEILRYTGPDLSEDVQEEDDTSNSELHFSPRQLELSIQREYLGLVDTVNLVEKNEELLDEYDYIPKFNCYLVDPININKKISIQELIDELQTYLNNYLKVETEPAPEGSSEEEKIARENEIRVKEILRGIITQDRLDNIQIYDYNLNKISFDISTLYDLIYAKEKYNLNPNGQALSFQTLKILDNIESFLDIAVNLEGIDNKQKTASGKYTIRYSTTHDLAKLNIYASGIVQSVQDTKLVFDAEGLSVYDGGIKVFDNQYIVASPQPTSEETLLVHDYYIETSSGFVKSEVYEAGIIYYEKQQNKVFGLDESGNLYVKGSGEFSGKIIAKEGEFTGTVYAKNGTLGDLTVNGRLTIAGDQAEIYLENSRFNLIELSAEDSVPEDLYYLNSETNQIEPYEGTSIIEEYKYYRKVKTPGIYSSNFKWEDNDTAGFWIDSNSSKIRVNDIELGNGALVHDIIKFEYEGTQALLMNPGKHNGIFIEAGQIGSPTLRIDTNGNIKAGNIINNNYIEINGEKGTIKSGNYFSGATGWKIDNNSAEFNDIVARGTLKSTVFEQNEVSTVGGTLLVRPSSMIKDAKAVINDRTLIDLILEKDTIDFGIVESINGIDGPEPYYFKIGNGNQGYRFVSYIYEENTNNNTKIGIRVQTYSEVNTATLIGQILIGYGNNGDIGIGINSSNSASAMPPQAISVFETVVEITQDEDGNTTDVTLRENPKIVLGKMDEDGKDYGLSKYGLYADQVNVRGELSSTTEEFYSGINSNSKIYEANSQKEDNRIVLWAGAKIKQYNTVEQAVQNAAFRVDMAGNVYASSGHFRGEIESSLITSSVLKAAVIQGIGPTDGDENCSAALTIEDAENGIRFHRRYEDEETKQIKFEDYFLLSNSAMRMSIPIISGSIIEDQTMIDNGKITTNSITLSNLNISSSEVYLQSNNDSGLDFAAIVGDEPIFVLVETEEGLEAGFPVLDGEVGIVYTEKKEAILSINKEDIRAERDIHLNHNVYYGDGAMEYKRIVKTTNGVEAVLGYDLYIKS